MSFIQITNLSFAYDGGSPLLFDGVSLNLDTQWRLGLIGRNGRGKTTFLQLLLGQYPHGGHITTDAACTYFPYTPENPEASALEVLQRLCPDCMDWMFQREASLLQIREEALYRPFCTLSQGEQTKILLIGLFLQPNTFPLIDEPTNHLDAKARGAVGRYLQKKEGFILVSHDRALLDACTDHILSINQAGIELQQGNYSSWQANRERQDQFEAAKKEKLLKDAHRLAAAADRNANWSERVEKTKKGTRISGLKPDRGYLGHQAAKMMKRSKTIEARRSKALEETQALLQNAERRDTLKMTPGMHPKERLAVLDAVSIFYQGRAVSAPVSFTVSRGERVALVGGNGSGKTSLLRCVLGQAVSHSGLVQLASGLRISYIPQDTSHLSGTISTYAEARGLSESLFRSVLNKLDFDRVQFDTDLSVFSQGQKKKVLLAASLCETAHLYVWDEPLNYIDVLSRTQIEAVLLACRPTLLFVEHDAAFVEHVATKTVQVQGV